MHGEMSTEDHKLVV